VESLIISIRHRQRSPALLLPAVTLTLVEEAVFDGGNELLWGAKIIRIVGLVASGKPYHGTVMEIVVPHGVEFVSSVVCWPDKLSILRLILGDKNRLSAAGLVAHRPPNGVQDK